MHGILLLLWFLGGLLDHQPAVQLLCLFEHVGSYSVGPSGAGLQQTRLRGSVPSEAGSSGRHQAVVTLPSLGFTSQVA